MQNQNTKLETLLQHAWLTLGQSIDELKGKYKNYPVFLIECIDKEVHEHIVEIRFDNEEATLSISFDSKNKSNTCFLFLDSSVDEELLIDYLVSSEDYNFRTSSFQLPSCSLKIKETKNEVCFYLFR